MPLVAAPARVGNFLDTDEPLNDAVLADIAARGFEGVFRYLPLPGNSALYDISPGELARICATKTPDGNTLQLGLVQHPRAHAYNDLTLHDPEVDAAHACDFAVAAGYPAGCHIALDFEDLSGIPVNTDVVCFTFASKWSSKVRDAGFRATLYAGFNVPLTADQLWEIPFVDQYWRGFGGPPAVSTRGYSVMQTNTLAFHGVSFDRNVIIRDKLGDVPYVATLAP